MVSLRLSALALLAWQSTTVIAQDGLKVEDIQELEDVIEDPSQQQSPRLNVDISTSFPQAEIFGVKLVNGRTTEVLLDVSNNEPDSVRIVVVGGSLSSPAGAPGAPDPPVILRNLTVSRYNVEIPAGEKGSLSYYINSEMHPQDVQLNVVTIFTNAAGKTFSKLAFNETVSVVEAPLSIFDPQIVFLYLFLAIAFGGTCFFIYQTWITRLFPQKRRGGKGGERAKRSSGQTKRVDPTDQVSVVGADGPAVTSGAKAYDASWIPAEHLKRPEAKRVGSGRPKSRAI